jgi:cyclopropane fatty-acyl-phospholipid synthase-like methyltransferase
LPERLFQAALTIENAFYEYRLGISTRGLCGFTPGDWSQREHIYYGTIPYRAIFRVLDSLALERSDVVVDLGCGKGRVLCCASLYDVGQVIGVEVGEELCEAAERNLRRMRRKRAPSAIIHGKAEEFDFARGTVFYMFHPFGPNTLKAALHQLSRGVREKPRPVRIVYVNPKHDAVLEETGWLERHAYWPARATGLRPVCYPVSFWRLRPSASEPVG